MMISIICALVAYAAGVFTVVCFGSKLSQEELALTHRLLGIDEKLKSEALRLVQDVEAKFSQEEGEFKRSQVYRALLNIFPHASKKDISQAIELAVQ